MLRYSEFDASAKWNGELGKSVWFSVRILGKPLPFGAQRPQIDLFPQAVISIGIKMIYGETGKKIRGELVIVQIEQVVFSQDIPFEDRGLKAQVTRFQVG